MSGAGLQPVTIAFPFMGGIVGGSHISAIKLIKGLDPREFKPLVILHRCEGPTVELLRAEGIAFEAAPIDCIDLSSPGRLRQLLAAPGMAWTLGRFLRDRNVKIVHTNDGPMHATWAIAARLAGAKLLWHHRGNPRAAGLRFVAPWLADRVVAVSKFASPAPGLISAANRCSVVHSPFDIGPLNTGALNTGAMDTGALNTGPFDPGVFAGTAAATAAASAAASSIDAQIAALDLPPGAILLGFFGHFVDRKRPLQFVEAIAAIVARRPRLVVVGLMFGEVLEPGLDAKVLARAKKLGIADNIRLMGFRTPPEPWLARCELLVVTAVDEPYGRTIIEAQLLGTPVVAAASGGNIEAIRHMETGVLVPPDRPAAFANAIIALLEDPPAARQLAATARAEAMTRYGIDGHVRSISDIYRQLAA